VNAAFHFQAQQYVFAGDGKRAFLGDACACNSFEAIPDSTPMNSVFQPAQSDNSCQNSSSIRAIKSLQ
jgi:hypothetical protein